jgi:hypothetical protein
MKEDPRRFCSTLLHVLSIAVPNRKILDEFMVQAPKELPETTRSNPSGSLVGPPGRRKGDQGSGGQRRRLSDRRQIPHHDPPPAAIAPQAGPGLHLVLGAGRLAPESVSCRRSPARKG